MTANSFPLSPFSEPLSESLSEATQTRTVENRYLNMNTETTKDTSRTSILPVDRRSLDTSRDDSTS